MRATLALECITRRHRLGREHVAVLHDVSLELWPGELVAILGAHRSGKTTLLRVAAGVEAPDAGAVRLDGVALATCSASERARLLRGVGYVPKSWRVARGKPVLDHVALPLLAAGRPLVTAHAKAYEAIERVGVLHCAGATPDELGPCDETRVALAQALVHEPRLLLLDEPGVLAAPEEREELLRLLRAVAAERPQTALLVTARDVSGLAGAARVLTLDAGVLRGAREPTGADVLAFPERVVEATSSR